MDRTDGFAFGTAQADSSAADRRQGELTGDQERRTELLKEYVSRLSHGDSLEAVRQDFTAHFQSVDAAEIVHAEQQLLQSGTPLAEVQKLCDVHSALFHGATREEQIANAEAAAQASMKAPVRKTFRRSGSTAGGDSHETGAQPVGENNGQPSGETADGMKAAASLSRISGHPVRVFAAENAAAAVLLQKVRMAVDSGADSGTVSEKLNAFRAVTVHYAEKGDLLYPLLKSRYGVSGPADVMWSVDGEIREELKALAEGGAALPDFTDRLRRLLARAEEMIYKESNILIPLCVEHFTEEDWMRIYYELPSYDNELAVDRPVWDAAEARRAELKAGGGKQASASPDADGALSIGSGHMTLSQIEAVFNTIPMELTFIDDRDINCFFNAGTEKKLFKRPDNAIGREVYFCHPPKFAVMARQVISSLKSGARDSVDVWLNKRGEPVYVRYMAVRNARGEYVGTLECVQKMGFAKEHFQETEK